ncbi:MAG TPA: glycosyltransferase family 2 protein, partial [Polyangiaceae bacterium]|nr:glycosyltransferase family 2 protein [Polyangiaceae bacterium]
PARQTPLHDPVASPTPGAPKVTICVPTIGRLEFLPAVKASIAAQTLGDFEVLVLDNASPEEVREDLAAWVREDPRVRVLRADERMPMWENFNRGVLGARGEYVAFCHDDDELCPTFLEKNVAFMDAHPRVGFCGSSHYDVGPDGAVLAVRDRVARTEAITGATFIGDLMRQGRSALAMQTVFFRRAVFPDGGFDTTVSRFFGDFLLLMRMAESWDVGFLAEPLVRVRLHPGQASLMSLGASVPMRTEVFLAYIDELRAKGSPLDTRLFERQVRRLHVLHLGWAWLAATGTDEARTCARAIGSVRGLPLGHALDLVEKVGPFRGARTRLADVVRKAALR